jgi:hypothetical protein
LMLFTNVSVADLKSLKAVCTLSLEMLPLLSGDTAEVTDSFQVVTEEQKLLVHSDAVSGLLLLPQPAAASTKAAISGSNRIRALVTRPSLLGTTSVGGYNVSAYASVDRARSMPGDDSTQQPRL